MADTLDLLTLAEGKAAVKLGTSTVYDALLLPQYITAVSRRIDELIGPCVNRSVTENHDGGGYFIYLKDYPVSSVTTITEYDGTAAQVLSAETNSTKTANDYLLDSSTGLLHRRDRGWTARFAEGRANVVAVFTAGRYASTAVVDAQVKLAASMMLGRVWRTEQASGSELVGEPGFIAGATFAVPNAVKELLQDKLQMAAG